MASSNRNVRSAEARKLAKDGTTWTPTERVRRDKLMRQFVRNGRKGVEVSSGNSAAYADGWQRIFGGKK